MPATSFKTNTLPTKTQENTSFIDKVKQPINNFKTNYNLGKLSEEENLAWSEYRKKSIRSEFKKSSRFYRHQR